MIQTSKRGWFMPCRMVWWWRANFSFQGYTIWTRSYIIPGSLMLSLEEKQKKEACEVCVRSASFPGFSLFLPRRRKRENPGTRLVQGDLSSETQGQIVGAWESLNGWKNMAWRKVKNGEKSPWEQCLTRPVPNGRRRSGFWLVPEKHKFSGTNQKPERRRPFGTGLVRHCPQGLFSPLFTFLRAIFFQPFRLSLAPTICPWVSEDEGDLSWPSLSMKKTQLLCKWALELKAVLYLSADLYLIVQTVKENHDWSSRDRRGQMFFPLPAVAASVLSF